MCVCVWGGGGGVTVDLFKRVAVFTKKDKLKSEMFNGKKNHKQKCFSLSQIRILNWEIITKNLVTFKLLKDEMKLRMKNIMEVHCKI